MTKQKKYEYLALSGLFLLFLVFLFPALLHARTVVRDNLRKADITDLKRALESYNNVHNSYVTPPEGAGKCTQSTDVQSWFFGNNSPLIRGHHMNAIPHDVREEKGHTYSYCVTSIRDGQTAGYYLEAILENPEPEIVAFDEDERRKFGYRILRENGNTLYRVCGGDEMQCKDSPTAAETE